MFTTRLRANQANCVANTSVNHSQNLPAMDTSMFGGSYGSYQLLAPPSVTKDVGCCKLGDDEGNVNVGADAADLPSWLKELSSMDPVDGLEFLRLKFKKRIYNNRIKRAFFKKSEVHGGRVNDVYRDDVVQVAILAPATGEHHKFIFNKDGLRDTLPRLNESTHRTLTLRTQFHIYCQLLNKSLDLMVAFQTGQIEMEGNMLASKCLKQLIECFATPLKYPQYKLHKIECWRWTLLSGMKLTYIDRHANFHITDRVGRIGRQDSTEKNSFVLDDDEVFVNLTGSAGGRARAGRLGINYISLGTNKGRKWTYGYKVDELNFNTDINVSQWLRENQMEARGMRDHHRAMLQQIRGDGGAPVAPRAVPGNNDTISSYIHCFRLRASDSIHAIGVGSIKDPKLFKRLDRSMKKTDGKHGLRRKPSMINNPNDGTKFFPVWHANNHHRFPLQDRKAIETFYFIVFLAKGTLFDKLKRVRGRAIPEVIIRYILQFY